MSLKRYPIRLIFAVGLLFCPLFASGGLAAGSFDQAAAAYDTGDYGKARSLWESALAEGDWDAARSLGTLYRWGLGVEADPVKAISYYRQAVDHDVLAATLNLAEMMLAGQGTDRDVAGAKKLLAAAADKGAAFARQRLEEVEDAESRDEAPPPLPERSDLPVQAATVPPELTLATDQEPAILKAHVASYKSEKAAALGWLSFNLPGLEPVTEWVSLPGKGRFLRLYAVGPAPIVEQLCAPLKAKGEPCPTTPMPPKPRPQLPD